MWSFSVQVPIKRQLFRYLSRAPLPEKKRIDIGQYLIPLKSSTVSCYLSPGSYTGKRSKMATLIDGKELAK